MFSMYGFFRGLGSCCGECVYVCSVRVCVCLLNLVCICVFSVCLPLDVLCQCEFTGGVFWGV